MILASVAILAALVGGQPPDGTSVQTADWSCVRQLSSGDNYKANGPVPGAVIIRFEGGAYQISAIGWQAFGGLVYAQWPALATPLQQDAVALRIYGWAKRQYGNGFVPWAVASRCGLV